MAGFGNYPEKYLLFNAQLSKSLAIVMQIEGVPDLYGIAETFTQVRYGDPGLVYGLPGLVYGGLRTVKNIKPYVVLDSSMVISQKIEPEQGKGNIGTLTMTLIDYRGEVSTVISPGFVVDEIMMSKEVKIWLGFTQTSFPEDYLLIYRGYITQLSCPPGVVKFQLSDGTTKKRQPIFNTPSTVTSNFVNAIVTTIPVENTTGFHQQILGPDGNYDPIVDTYILVGEEWMKYSASGIVDSTHFSVTRSQLGTGATTHDADTTVTNGVLLGGNAGGVHFIDLVLKILLSGWDGPCETDISLVQLSVNGDTSAFELGNNEHGYALDAKMDLGLTIGDYFTISGASNPGNNVTGLITGFDELNGAQRIILTDQIFTPENPTGGVAAFRSKYDTLPVTCGVKCRMKDVDVETLELIKHTYFTSASDSNIRIFYNAPIQGKDAIDTDILLPMGCYGISRYGRISMSVTKPPLPGIGKLVELNFNNIIDPQNIVVQRSTNSRSFYNLISFQFDQNPATGAFENVEYFLDTESLNKFNQTSQLPIVAPGLHSDLGGAVIAQRRARALLTRYRNCVLMIEVTVLWGVGSLIEVSDIVILNDSGNLKIMNFETGERNLGIQLFEVIDRTYNIMDGNVKLKLMGGLGFNVNSRFGLYSPSTIINSGSSSSSIRVTPSFGQTAISAELAKWTPFIGLPVKIHSYDWSVQGTANIVGVDPSDPTAIQVDPPLGFTPSAGYIMDIGPYPTGTNPKVNAKYKALYAYITPTIAVTSGVSNTQFNVSLGDTANMTVGNTIILRNSDYSVISPEVIVQSIVGTLVTTAKSLGFTPSSSYKVEGVGFKDMLGYYRYG